MIIRYDKNTPIIYRLIFLLFQGELVWFDPGVGHVLPGEVLEYHKPAQVLTVQAVIAGKVSATDWEIQYCFFFVYKKRDT